MPGTVATVLQDGSVAFVDFVHLLGGWGTEGPDPAIGAGRAIRVVAKLATAWPDLDVVDALGWVRLLWGHGDLVGVSARGIVRQWADVGMVEDGWLFAGAGFTPVEAQAGLAQGLLTREIAQAMSGLRSG